MKHFKHCTAFLAVAALAAVTWALAACTADDDLMVPGAPGTETAETDEITVNFTVDNMTNGSMGALGRSDEVGDSCPDGHPAHAAEAHEKQIDHVYFLFFGKDSRFITYQRATVEAGATKITFPVPSSLQTLTDYSVLMVANADFFPPVGFSTFPSFLNANTQGKTYTQVRDLLAIGVDHTMTKHSDKYLPMQGILTDENAQEIKFNFDVVNGRYTTVVTNVAILFKRDVCRVDLNNYCSPSELNIEWVKICNYRNTTYACRDFYTAGTVQPAINDDAPDTQTPYYIQVDPAEEDGTGLWAQKVKASLYCFPNSVAKPSQDDAVTTYVMIAAHYKEDENLTYYRFNLNRGTEAQYLERNHIYTANIMGVKGPGAPTESAARLTDAPVLVALVEETWDDDDVNSDADAAGNFLILSRTSLTFDGAADLTQRVTVRLREGMTWKIEAVDNTGNSNSDFSVVQDVAKSEFTVKTLTRNNTNFVKYGYFKVSGLTADGKVLSVMVKVQQLSVNDDVKMLTVNGQTGTLTPRISGTGTTFLFQVQTGSTTQGWNVKPENENDWTPWASSGASYTKAGGNKGFLEISIPANITGSDREITLVVTRQGVTPEEVAPVKIKLSQPKSKILLSVFPYPQNGILEVEGFLNELRIAHLGTNENRSNSFSVQKDIFVTLADPVKYQYKVETNFDWYRDVRLSASSALMRTVKCQHCALNTANMQYQTIGPLNNGDKFYLNVFRTAPGDPDIVGTVKITAYPKSGYTGEQQSISFDLRVVTSCEIADAVIYSGSTPCLVSDRNMGAVSRLNGTVYTRALNFSNVANLKVTGYTTKTDQDNKLYSGSYYTWDEMNDAGITNFVTDEYLYPNMDVNKLTSPFYTKDDIGKWSVPNNAWLNQISYYVQWSKYRPYIVSDIMHGNQYMGCFIPLAGTGSNAAGNVVGYYWSSDNYNASQAWMKAWDGNPDTYAWNTCHYSGHYHSAQYTVRPIRLMTAAEVDTYKTWLQRH